jgi:hypothetical protein
MAALHEVEVSRPIELSNVFCGFIQNSSPPAKVTAGNSLLGLPRETQARSGETVKSFLTETHRYRIIWKTGPVVGYTDFRLGEHRE